MISFFILLILIITLLGSEYVARHLPKSSKENFSNFTSLINNGKCSRSLTQRINKFYGNKVINPFPKCSHNKFNWKKYFKNSQSKFQAAPFNTIYY